MTIYERLSVILSIIAILIPIGKLIWSKYLCKPKLLYYTNQKAVIFFNQSGAYIRIDGVFEAKNKSITIKKVDLKLTRSIDDKQLNLSWSSFISPVSQSIIGNYLQSTEKAHPIRVEADSVCCAFTEFADEYESAWKIFNRHSLKLNKMISEFQDNRIEYAEALEKYKDSDEYKEAYKALLDYFYWQISKYKIEITAYYLKGSTNFKFGFEINENDNSKLNENIEEALLILLKKVYGVQSNINYALVELRPID